jgi:phosphoribosylglycinamide formyltransferase-1
LLDHRDYPCREDLDAAILQVLWQHHVEWVIMAGWMRMVPRCCCPPTRIAS